MNEIELKGPAVFLCFDDCHIDEWYRSIGFFDHHNMKVTFYLSDIAGIRLINHGWEKVRELQAHGHTIAYHGMNHLRAGNLIAEEGCEVFFAREIIVGMNILLEEGFEDIRHYCYPYGNRTPESDKCLLTVFDTLRQGGRKIYTQEEMKQARLIRTAHYQKKPSIKNLHEPMLNELIKRGHFIALYMHNIIQHRLDFLTSLKGLNFLPMSTLDRKTE